MDKNAIPTAVLNGAGLGGDSLFRSSTIHSGFLPDEKTYQGLSSMGYEAIVEKTFTSDHAALMRWTAFFGERLNQKRIFDYFLGPNFKASVQSAQVVGPQWLRFSAIMPKILCRAAVQVDSNECRHYVIQTAFEELGMRREDEIHCNLFRDVVRLTGVVQTESDRIDPLLNGLYETLTKSQTQSSVLGLLLGLEIPAQENVETVFRALAHDAPTSQQLAETLFFRLHRLIEPEHVRLTVSNFLRFCETETQKQEFTEGFDAGLVFWNSFWKQAEEELADA